MKRRCFLGREKRERKKMKDQARRWEHLYSERMRGECRRLLSGSHVFSDEGYPFHVVRYSRRPGDPL